MAVLKAVYNQMRNEYVQNLCKLNPDEFLSTLEEMVTFPPVTLEISHIHQILQQIVRTRNDNRPTVRERNKVYGQFWENILTPDQNSWLNPAADRRGVMSRWFGREWESQVLESMARYPAGGLTHDNWLQWIARRESRLSYGDRGKHEIAYEQAYRLATDGTEKYKILLSAWRFHFSHALTEEPCPYRKGRIERMLEEHIRGFPEDIPRLQKDFRELIGGGEDGRTRRAGWAGIAVVGAGIYEDELVERLKLRVGSLNMPHKERMLHPDTTMGKNAAEELEGMTRWRPLSENNRKTLCQRLTNLLLDGCRGRVEKHVWNKHVWAALWQARFRLETEEEQLLKEIAPMMHGLFGGQEIPGPPNQPVAEKTATLALWQPQSPEIQQRWHQLWEECLSRSFSSRYRPATPHVFWTGLVEINPRHPRLGELLLQYLSEKPDAANDLYTMEAITTWLRQYGLPPETTPEVRARLEQKSREHLVRQLSAGCSPLVQSYIGALTFYIMAATPPDVEENHGRKRTEMAAEVLENVELLAEMTEWLENSPLTPARQWQPVIHNQWERKLMALSPATPPEEVKPVLEYFARTIRRDPEACPHNLLAEKVLLLVEKGKHQKSVTMAARLGKQLLPHMEDDFAPRLFETVRQRARTSYEQGSQLLMSLHIIRQEYVINALSEHLAELETKKPARKTTEEEAVRDEARREANIKGETNIGNGTKADREVAEKITLRDISHMFPEIGGGRHLMNQHRWNGPPRMWSQTCLDLITGDNNKGGRTQAMVLPDLLLPRDDNKPAAVFQDRSRLTIPGQPPAPSPKSGVVSGGLPPQEAFRKKRPEF